MDRPFVLSTILLPRKNSDLLHLFPQLLGNQPELLQCCPGIFDDLGGREISGKQEQGDLGIASARSRSESDDRWMRPAKLGEAFDDTENNRVKY